MRSCVYLTVVSVALVADVSNAKAQTADESPWVFDIGVGIDLSINGNVTPGSSAACRRQAMAILPNPYSDVYGTGIHFRGAVGYTLSAVSELRAIFTYQSADADLVRLGDIGPSSLYAQYSDYKTIGLDLGYRRYVPVPARGSGPTARGPSAWRS